MESTRWILRAERRHFHRLRWTLESYDGLALVSTLDSEAGLLEVRVPQGAEGTLREILHALWKEFGVWSALSAPGESCVPP